MGGEWRKTLLRKLGRIVTGKTPSTRNKQNFGGSIPFITPIDMDGRRYIDVTERYLTKLGALNVAGARIPSGTIMVSCIGSDMGKVAIAATDSVTNQQINSIIIETEDLPLFVYYNLSTRKNEIKAIAGGSAQPILNKKDFGNIEILLPPLPEQRAIARILGALDDKIELNRRMNETLEAMAQALFKSWFVDFDPVVVNALRAGNPIPEKFAARAAHYRENPSALSLPDDILRLFPDRFVDSELGPIPEGWEVRPLLKVAELRTETIVPKSEPEAVWEHYSIPAFDEGRMPKHERGIAIKSAKFKVSPTSVLASKLNPQFLRVWLPKVGNEARAICSTEFMPFIPIKPQWRSLLYELLKSDLVQEGIRSAATGSTGSRQRVKPKTVASMPIIVAPAEILDAFCELTSSLHTLVLAYEHESRALAALRDTLLPKLISGELRVPDVEKILEEAGI